ncbi:hypothetical protein C8J57DRAFT_1482519 [Mycena rebaudengoi]|nr:hypothetical protein C8J57DRAFT_1482519 [Mycena rebaudengoi]
MNLIPTRHLPMPPHLADLDVDILYIILRLCDVYTLLSMAQVNRSFERIARAKHIWIFLIRDLSARRLIDLPHNRPLQDYSTAQLIEEVKRLVVGPKTWSRPSASTVSRKISIPRSTIEIGRRPELKLLPGGTYLAVIYLDGAQLLHVPSQTVIWRLQSDDFGHPLFELSDDDTSALFLSTDAAHRIKLIGIDLKTGDATELFTSEVPGDTALMGGPVISGQFIIYDLAQSPWTHRYFVLANWRTDTIVVLKFEHLAIHWNRLELIAGYLLYTICPPFPSDRPRIELCPVEELFSRWPSNTSISLEDAIDSSHLPVIVMGELPFLHRNCMYNMTVYESPLRRDTYKVMIYHVGPEPPRSSRFLSKWIRQKLPGGNPKIPGTLYTFHVSIPPNGVVDWALTSSVPALPVGYLRHVSYAGYVMEQRLFPDVAHVVVGLRGPQMHERRGIQETQISVGVSMAHGELSPYSHALVSFDNSDYVISYYL